MSSCHDGDNEDDGDNHYDDDAFYIDYIMIKTLPMMAMIIK